MSGESGESSGGEREPEPEPAAGCGTAAPPVYESGCHRPTEPAGGAVLGRASMGAGLVRGGSSAP